MTDIRQIILPDTGYPTKNKLSFNVKKNLIFYFSFFSFSFFQFSFSFFQFSHFFITKNSGIAHNMYNFKYTVTRHPTNKTGYPAGYLKRPDICLSGYSAVRISGCLDIRLSGYPAIRISGCPDIRLSGYPLQPLIQPYLG